MKRFFSLLVIFIVVQFSVLATAGGKDILSQEERQWLIKHEGKIRYAPLPNYPPIDFIDSEGTHKGVTADYLRRIEQKLDFRFAKVQTKSWNEIIEKAKQGEIDVIGSIQNTPERREYLRFTKPYLEIPNVIIVKEEYHRPLTLEKMGGMKVVIVKGYASVSFIKNNHPKLIIEPVINDLAGLQMVSFGRADAIITDLSVASYLIEQMKISNLRVAGTIDYTWNITFASRKDWPILNNILEKGLAAIDQKERHAIYSKWVPSGYEDLFPRKKLFLYIAIILSITGGGIVIIFIWNRMLKRQVTQKTVQLRRELDERKQAEEALRESEKKYRTILESIEDGYYEVDLAGNFTFFNDSMCEISGYSRDELMGMNYRQYTNEQDSEKLYNTLNKVYTTGKPSRIMDHMMVRKDGTERHIELSGSLIKDSEGHRIGFRGIIRDVTERKKLESQLIQSQKMETIGILAGGVAHDLNNILSGIISYPELLLMDLPEGSPLRKPLLTIKSSGERAAVVVQDLLTMARRGVTITEIVNLNSIISEQLKSPECEKLKSFHLNVDIKTNLEKDLLNIKGSTAHLSKTVMNLISNAAEAMPDGGKVLISTENLYIDRPIRGYDHVNEGDYVTVTVIDTGIGISKKDMNRIFEPFYTKKVMGRSGTGLGMAVVWGTVKDHNGYIDVKSTKGKGTTFTLYFPVIRQELAIDKSLISIEDYMGKGESILIVDDVEEQRDIASVMLKKLGYSVTSVSSGEEAIEYMKDNSADLLVLDMIMDPGIDGLDTYKKILKLHPKQKAIIASGFSETDRVKKAKKLGAGAYVKKPYVLGKIGLVIKEELEK